MFLFKNKQKKTEDWTGSFGFVEAMFTPPAADSEGPSAPPASMFDSMPGYEGTVSGGGGTVTQWKTCSKNVALTM